VRVPTRGAARESLAPYMDIELCFDADQSQLSLVRSVAAEVAHREGARTSGVETLRHVASMMSAALIALADRDAEVHCLFRVLDGEIRLSVSVEGAARPSPEAKAEHARLLDQLIVSASTFTQPNDSGGFNVVSDAFVGLGGV
jgi:hypothetical protein